MFKDFIKLIKFLPQKTNLFILNNFDIEKDKSFIYIVH